MFIEIILVVIVVLLIVLIGLIAVLLRRGGEDGDKKFVSALERFEANQDKMESLLREEFQRSREESTKTARENREELNDSFSGFEKRLSESIKELNALQKEKFDDFSRIQKEAGKTTETRLEKMRETVESKLKELQDDNSRKLEKMRETVDEKLQKTLKDRIGESFKMVTDQLELVYKGLGDMQKLATGVGDLKKVLTNVKTRGTMGEIQLGNILEQFLSPEQYIKNARIKEGTTESVEFAVKLPGNEQKDDFVLLPIDSKFPVEDYQRLVEMYDQLEDHTKEELQKAENNFDAIVKRSAKQIFEKYLEPPITTNFAIMFLPTEGLYAQVLRRTGLFESLQRDYKITVVGPSNLVAFLNSLQMGFRTLAVQKRSNEVWQILSAVKTEFGQFETVLRSAQDQINKASGKIDTLVGTRTRAMQRKLKEVESLPGKKTEKLLGFEEEDLTPEDE